MDAIRKIEAFSASVPDADAFYESELIFDGTLMNFIVLGEMVAKISTDTQDAHPGIPWKQVKDFRNIVAHHYFGVDAEEVWQIIQSDLPTLKGQLRALLEE